MQFLSLFIVALMPVLKVLLVTAIGLFLATEGIDLLGATARNHLNNLVFYIFTPALISNSLADTITLNSLVTLWFMPVNIFLTFLIGSILGWILVKITRTPQHLRGLVIGCCSAGNIGNLLLIILPALCEESSSPFGELANCSSYAEAYAALSMAVLAVYLWSYVYFIMRLSANDETVKIDGSRIVIDGSEETSDSYREALLASSSEDCQDIEISQTRPVQEKVKIPVFAKIEGCIKAFTGKINLKMVFAPSTIAAIIGFIIGIVSPIRKLLIGDSAPLRVIYNAANFLGEAAIPCITLIVGANLLKGLKGSGAGLSVIIGIIAIRFVMLPPIGIGVVKLARHFGIVGSDSLYQFSLMLQYAVPPAMNIGTISQLLKAGGSECSVIMLWTYVVATFFLTLWSALFMSLVA